MKNTINLNGKWKFAPAFDQKPTNNHHAIDTTVPLYALTDLVRTDWEDVRVPGVWQMYAEKYSVFEGVCWFYREFVIESLKDDSFAELVCKGINYKATIYVNGKILGIHESAYTEFSFDISKFLIEGKNSISIEVDNRPTVVKWPNDWGYGVFGGIHRDIFVNVYESEYVYDIEITPDYDIESQKGVLSFSAKGRADEVCLKLEGNKDYIIKNENGEFKGTFNYDVFVWSPENPKLYKLSVLVGDELYEENNIGFRNISCKNREFLLNGKPIELKGACYLCDSPITGLAMDKEELRKDLISMKEANVNAIRTHYPMSDSFYELCDEMGFLVWIEPNIYCSKPDINETNTVFKQEDFIEVAVSMTEEMIKGAKKFASVAIYGIGNECNTDHPESVPFFEKISDTVRKSDSSRPVGYATLYGQIGRIAHAVDIVGINSYYGWYDVLDEVGKTGIKEERNGIVRTVDLTEFHKLIEKVDDEIPKDKVMLITEFGADSTPGYISPDCALWSEDYHAQVIEKCVEAMREHLFISGFFVFAFTDYHDPSKPLNGRWNGFNLKGMLTFDRKIKLPYYALQKMYNK